MRENAYEEGNKILEQMLGEGKSEYLSMLEGLQEGLGTAIVEQIYGNLYGREGLDLKTRQLITVALLLSNGSREQLLFHTQCALNLGSKKEEIVEMILQSITIVGLPKALLALKTVNELF